MNYQAKYGQIIHMKWTAKIPNMLLPKICLAKILLLNTFLLSLALYTSSALASKPTPAQMKPVMQLMSQKQFSKAAQQLETLDRTGHCCDSIHYFLGVCYQNLNQLEQAKANYAKASSSSDPSINYWSQVGYSQVERYQATRSHEGAANNFDRVGNSSGALIGSGGSSSRGRSGFS